jgi:hypothetical protein
MGGVFISYRRSDSKDIVGRLYDYLRLELAPRPVFRDVYDLKAGSQYEHKIRQALKSSGVVLVVIGPKWLAASASRGQRLYDPDDFLRAEIASALAWNIPVIPVLVDGASMPAATDLPPDLQGLRAFQSIKLSDELWPDQAPRLLGAIIDILGIQVDYVEPVRYPVVTTTHNRGCAVGGIIGLIVSVLALAGIAAVVVFFVVPFIREQLREAEITLSKSSGPPGTSLTIDGKGFNNGETVVLNFHTVEVGRVKADDNGEFHDKRVEVPSDWTFTGQFDFRATGNSSVKSASMPFQVT